jgi:hypothetical protein
LGEPGCVYEFVGGYYAHGRGEDRHVMECISFFELPSLSDEEGRDDESSEQEEQPELMDEDKASVLRRWKHVILDISVIDFTMDPTHDLLVLVAPAPLE